MTKYNVLKLREDLLYVPSYSLDTLQSMDNLYSIKLWGYLRSKYCSFAQSAAKGQYDNTLTCYTGTHEAMLDFLKCSDKVLKAAIKDLKEKGLIVTIPYTTFSQELGKMVTRNNIVALDWGLEDYSTLVNGCKIKLQGALATTRSDRQSRQTQSLNYLNRMKPRSFIHVASKRKPVKEPEVQIEEPRVEQPQAPVMSEQTRRLISQSMEYDFNPFAT